MRHDREQRAQRADGGRSLRSRGSNPTAAARGPGQDITRSAAFDPDVYADGVSSLVVLGEPNPQTTLSDKCRRDLQAHADWVLSDEQPEPSATSAIEVSCRDELLQFAWDDHLLEELGSHLSKEYGIDEILAASFGSRLLEAIAASKALRNVKHITLVAPAPSSMGMSLGELVASRVQHTSEAVCSGSDICRNRSDGISNAVFYAALMNAAYAWDTNEAILADFDFSDPETLEILRNAARSFIFVDPSGRVDPQLLSYLAIQCSAYELGEPHASSIPSEEPFRDFLARLLAPCASIKEVVQPLSAADIGTIAASICIVYSVADPVTGESEALTFANHPSIKVVEDASVSPGHWPAELLNRMEGQGSCE